MSEMIINIEEDGTITVKTGDIADQHHLSAEEFLEGVEELTGHRRVTEKREHPFWKNRRVLKGGKIVKARR